MTPEFERRMRKSKGLFLLVWGAAAFVVGWFLVNPYVQEPLSDFLSAENKAQHVVGAPVPMEPPEPPAPPVPVDEWLYVNTNNVLLWPMVQSECKQRHALMQVHKGTKVLVIHRHGVWVEVEQENQSALHTHGCIHESMLRQDDG